MKLIEKNIGPGPDGTTIFQYSFEISEDISSNDTSHGRETFSVSKCGEQAKKRGRKAAGVDLVILEALKIAGYSNVAIGKKLKINESTVRKYLKEVA